MDFTLELTDEQRALRGMLREFADAEIAPHAGEWDRSGTFPAPTIRKLGELGVMGLPFPEQYGGLGAGTVSMAVALGGAPILSFGNEAQKQRWLVPLARGETIGAFASTEPGMGSDVQGLSTSARQDGDGWILNGTKAYITN